MSVDIKLVESIKKNERAVTLFSVGDIYRVSNKRGVDYQYWDFFNLREALDRFNKIAELFEKEGVK